MIFPLLIVSKFAKALKQTQTNSLKMTAIDNFGNLHDTLASAEEANKAFDEEMRVYYHDKVAEFNEFSTCFNRVRVRDVFCDEKGEDIEFFRDYFTHQQEKCFNFVDFIEATDPYAEFCEGGEKDFFECLKIATGRDIDDYTQKMIIKYASEVFKDYF